MERFNSASRLYKILKKASEFPDGHNTSEVWSKVMGFDRSNKIRAFESAVELDYLIKKVHEDASSFAEEETVELYTGALSGLHKLPSTFLGSSSWSSGKNIIDNGVFVSLKFCEELIAKSDLAEGRVEESQLDSFSSKVENLFDSVFYSDLPRPVKLSLLDKINEVKFSIRRYHVRGMSGVESEVSAVIGAACLHNSQLKSDSSWQTIQKNFNALYGDFISLAQAANVKFDLLDNVSDFVEKISEL